MYRLTATDSIIRIADGASIPPDPANRDYAEYLEWVAKGGVPESYVAPPPTAEEQRAAVFKADATRQDLLNRLKTASLAQIDNYIDGNVTNLAQARAFLKALTKVLALHIRD